VEHLVGADNAHHDQVDLLWMCYPVSLDQILITQLQAKAGSFLFLLSSDEIGPAGRGQLVPTAAPSSGRCM